LRGEALAAATAWAIGAWCASGVVAPEAADGVGRIGVFAPWWWLGVLLCGAWAAAWLARLTRRTAAPLWLPLVSVLPWMPLPLPPAALLAVGPLGQCLAAVCVIASAFAVLLERPIAFAYRARFATVILPLTLLFGASACWVSPRIPGGDEPHYLIITQSLLADGDLRIEDNHRRREYAAYADGDIKPDYLRRGRDGAIYSIHAPGVSLLVLPAFRIAGYPGAVLMLAALGAVGLVVAWRSAYHVTGSLSAAYVAAAGVGLSVPYFFQTFTIYPDGPAAVAVAVVLWLALARRHALTWQRALACGLLLGALPWLHTRYGAIAGPMGLVVAARLLWPREDATPATRARALTALAVPALVSAIAWIAMFQAIYGTWDPRAPYGHATDMRWARIPHGLAGLLLDQQFGLLPNAPICIAAIAGFAALWRCDRRLTVELLVTILPYVAAVAGFHMWWGGRSSPARFLVPVLLPLALPLAAWWTDQTSRTARALTLVVLAASLCLTATFVLVDHGALIYNSRDGHALWLLAVNPSVNLTYALPSLFQAGPMTATLLAAIWGATMACAWMALRRLERRQPTVGPWLAAVVGATVLVVAVGASLGWAREPGTAWDTGNGLVEVAARACGPDALGVGSSPARISRATHLLAGLPIRDASRRPPRDDVPRWSAVGLPPGRYRLVASSGLNVTGTVTIALGRPDRRLMSCTFADQPPGATACEVALPAGASALWIVGDAAVTRTADGLALTLVEPGAASRCGLRAERAVVTPAGTLFVTGGRAWAEAGGFWTAGGETVEAVVESTSNTVPLRIRQGGAAGSVGVRAGAWRDQRHLGSGDLWDVDIPRRAADPVVEFSVTTKVGFRPLDRDPSSGDARLLGAWVERR
jgi:hypothetical protein